MSISNISNENFKFMMASSVAFMQNKEAEGKVCFEAAPVEQKERVFEQMWIDRGKPMGDLKYGEHAFRNQYGLSSTNLEKSYVIDRYVSFSLMKNNLNNKEIQKMQEYNLITPSVYDSHVKMEKDHKFYKDMSDNAHARDKFFDKLPPVPPQHEKLIQGVVIGTMTLATAVLVADGIRKAMGH